MCFLYMIYISAYLAIVNNRTDEFGIGEQMLAMAAPGTGDAEGDALAADLLHDPQAIVRRVAALRIPPLPPWLGGFSGYAPPDVYIEATSQRNDFGTCVLYMDMEALLNLYM